MGSSKQQKRAKAIRDAFFQLSLEERERLINNTNYLLSHKDMVLTSPSSSKPLPPVLDEHERLIINTQYLLDHKDVILDSPKNPAALEEQEEKEEQGSSPSPQQPNLVEDKQDEQVILQPSSPQMETAANPSVCISEVETVADLISADFTVQDKKTEAQKPSPPKLNFAGLFKDRAEGMMFYEPETVAGVQMGRITKECVDTSCKQWDNTVICRVLGSHPPLPVMDRFFRKVWWKSDIKKVWLISSGVFMVKFGDIAVRNQIVERGLIYFENKPVMILPWQRDFKCTKPSKIPVWVQLPDLDPIYWTPEILSRILSPIGIPLMMDTATHSLDRLQYARVQIQMEIQESLPTHVSFLDEKGNVQRQKLEFEWQPVQCTHCSMLGHAGTQCKRLQQSTTPAAIPPAKKYVPKQKVATPKPAQTSANPNPSTTEKPKATDTIASSTGNKPKTTSTPPSPEENLSPEQPHRPGKEPCTPQPVSSHVSEMLHFLNFGTVGQKGVILKPPIPPDG